MDEGQFRKKAGAELEHLAKGLDGFAELTVDLANEILTIEFEDGERFVANLQGPTRQIWFAAQYQAAHYDFDAAKSAWCDSKTGEALRARVSRDVSGKLKKQVAL